MHGAGAFQVLAIPGLAERNASPDRFLPITANHPDATARFISPPRMDTPGYVDLGLWNVFGNPDFPATQTALRTLLQVSPGRTEDSELLGRAIGMFKTPGLRDLGHSAPYLHTGAARSLEDVLRLYLDFSELSRTGNVRNGDAELNRIFLRAADLQPLAAFLRALNEDYE